MGCPVDTTVELAVEALSRNRLSDAVTNGTLNASFWMTAASPPAKNCTSIRSWRLPRWIKRCDWSDLTPNLRRRTGIVVRSGAHCAICTTWPICLSLGANAILPYAIVRGRLGHCAARQPQTAGQSRACRGIGFGQYLASDTGRTCKRSPQQLAAMNCAATATASAQSACRSNIANILGHTELLRLDRAWSHLDIGF